MILAYPWVLILLPLPLLIRYLLPSFSVGRPAVRVPMFEVFVQATGTATSRDAVPLRRGLVQATCYVSVWVLLVVALAKPQTLQPPITKEIPTRDLMLAIDLSGSMETKDFRNPSGEIVTRLDAVKEVLNGFLAKRHGDRVGMIVFGSGAFVQIPFTQDLEVCQELLDQTAVRMAGPKTALGDAIGLAITVFERSELDERMLICLTDGNDTGSRVPPTEAAKIAADNGITLYTIGIGDPTIAGEEAMDEETLQRIAESTGGSYFFAEDRSELQSIYEKLDALSVRPVESTSVRPKTDHYASFVAIAFLISIVYFVLTSIGSAGRRLLRPAPFGGDPIDSDRPPSAKVLSDHG
ncbi:MAG: VWA domain-containing protein [Planctomycetota bacterium]